LEKNPANRFESAGELAAELKRYLAGQPILSRPISRTARVWRWCRNDPVVSGLSAAVVLTLVLGTTISAYFAILSERRARIATEQTQLALDTITTIIFEINGGLREIPEAGEQRRLILKNAIQSLESVSQGFENAAEVNSNRAGALINLGDIYSRLGDEEGLNASARSFELFKKSVEQFQQLVDVEGVRDQKTLWRYSVALQRVASDLVDSGKTIEAQPYLERCNELRRELADNYPDNREYSAGVIHILYEWGDNWETRSNPSKAVGPHTEGLERAKKLLEKYPDDREINSLYVVGHNNLGDCYYSMRQYEKGEEYLQRGDKIYRQLIEKFPGHKELPFNASFNREYLGNLYFVV